MTISSGSQIDAADLNTLYDDARDTFNTTSGTVGNVNKHRKCYLHQARFEGVADTTYGATFNCCDFFTPVADTRLYGWVFRAKDASGPYTVSAKLEAVSITNGDGTAATVAVLDETEYRYMGGKTYELSVSVNTSLETVFSSNLTRDATNGDSDELVLFGGITYRIAVKTSGGVIDFAEAMLVLESSGQRVAL